MRKIIIILDGLADSLKTKTSLELANTPILDKLAKNSLCGLMYPIKNIAPESGEAQFVILGNKLKDFPGRGPLEALGSNIILKNKEIALRGNFAEIKNNRLIKKRAAPPTKQQLKILNKIHKDIKIIPTIGYRCVIKVKNASPDISNTDPGYIKIKNYSTAVPVKLKRLKFKGHKATSQKLNYFIKELEKILKTKTILLRGAGAKPKKLKQLKKWAIAAEMPVEIGLGKILGMKILKTKNIKKVLKTKSNLYIQIKGPDPAGHLGNKKQKIRIIEGLDKSLKLLLKLKDIVVITADHATPPELKCHSKDPVPFLIYNKKPNNIKKFTERACKKGKIIQGKDLMKLL